MEVSCHIWISHFPCLENRIILWKIQSYKNPSFINTVEFNSGCGFKHKYFSCYLGDFSVMWKQRRKTLGYDASFLPKFYNDLSRNDGFCKNHVFSGKMEPPAFWIDGMRMDNCQDDVEFTLLLRVSLPEANWETWQM